MKIELNGNEWRVRQAGAARSEPAVVPGCIHKDLRRAGLIPDPQFRDNEKQLQWVGETDWTYECDFVIPADLWDYERIELVCDGLDTLVTIRLNGTVVAHTENMHRRYRFDVAGQLQAGTNRLEIVFTAPLPVVRARQAARALPLVPPKHLNLFDPLMRVETSGSTCRITVQRPALWVWADAPVGQSWSDNFFHLRPGVEKEVSLPGQAGAVWHSLDELKV